MTTPVPKRTAEPWTPETDPDVIARRKLTRKEYGQFVAVQDIPVGLALAYRAGDAVPASNVEAHGYEAAGLVERIAAAEDFDDDDQADAPDDTSGDTPTTTRKAAKSAAATVKEN